MDHPVNVSLDNFQLLSNNINESTSLPHNTLHFLVFWAKTVFDCSRLHLLMMQWQAFFVTVFLEYRFTTWKVLLITVRVIYIPLKSNIEEWQCANANTYFAVFHQLKILNLELRHAWMTAHPLSWPFKHSIYTSLVTQGKKKYTYVLLGHILLSWSTSKKKAGI